MISTAHFQGFLDGMAASYRVTDDTNRSSRLGEMPLYIVGDGGLSGGTYPGCGDIAFITSIYNALTGAIGTSNPPVLSNTIFGGLLQAVEGYIAKLGLMLSGNQVATLDQYLSYLNSTPFTLLVDPRLATEYLQYKNGVSGVSNYLMLSPTNVFAPATEFGTVVVGSGGSCTYTNVGSIPTTNNTATGAQGYTPAETLQAMVTTTISGTETVTVTGNGVNSAGAAITGATWTGTLSSETAGSTVNFTPTVSGNRISAITGVAGTGTATSGAFTLQSAVDRVVT